MTDSEPVPATGGPKEDATALRGVDDRIADIRRQRDTALGLGDRETAREFDALERELYDAGAGAAGAETGDPGVEGSGGAATDNFDEATHGPLTADEAEGVFAFLDTVDADGTAGLRAEWGGEAGAHLGHAHLWFVTQYTQAERDSMVVTPGLVRMAARMGRKLAADGQERQAAPTGGHDGDGAADADQNPAALRRRRQDAQRAGDYRRAQALDEEERAAWARVSGDAPIVGRAGRNL